MTARLALDHAAAIGDRLASEAIWWEGRALWLGDERERVDTAWETVHRSLGGDLYGGSAGIGLFLTRLWMATGERNHRQAALGALRHAVAWTDSTRPPSSLYSGAGGVACAAAEAAVALGDEELLEQARAVALESLARPPAGRDLIGGRAGAVVALLHIARTAGLSEARTMAETLAGSLAAEAIRTPEGGAAWRSDGGADEPPLCGLAHGASGVAYALGCVAEAVGDANLARFPADAALYERSWFRRDEGNWPDLREVIRRDVRAGRGPGAMVAWCHGAVGIGLERLRSYEASGDTVLRADAEAALAATLTHEVEQAHAGRVVDASLCHGVAGAAELLMEGARVFRQPRLRGLAADCMQLAAAAADGGAWPCGVPGGGENPSLMLGLAGIGVTFLRLADPEMPPTGLLYPPPIVSRRIVVTLAGEASPEELRTRANELAQVVPGSRVERIGRSGRILLRVENGQTVEEAVAVLANLDDVAWAEPDVVDRAQ